MDVAASGLYDCSCEEEDFVLLLTGKSRERSFHESERRKSKQSAVGKRRLY
jgi:hypothetical protein